jgi:hypothetical protein
MSDEITPTDLARLREVCEAATPGPWIDDHAPWMGLQFGVILKDGRVIASCTETTDDADKFNAAFIAAAREWLPKLLGEVERLRKLAEKRGQLEAIADEARDKLFAENAALKAELERARAVIADGTRFDQESANRYADNMALRSQLAVAREELADRAETLSELQALRERHDHDVQRLAVAREALEGIVCHEEAYDRGDAYTATEARAALAKLADKGGA